MKTIGELYDALTQLERAMLMLATAEDRVKKSKSSLVIHRRQIEADIARQCVELLRDKPIN